MVEIERLQEKWRFWLLNDLFGQFKVLMDNLSVYRAFENAWGSVDCTGGDEIATWIILNYFESACLADRRLGDKNKGTRSLRALLEDMKQHPYAFPKFAHIANDPSVGTSVKTPQATVEYFVKMIDEDIQLIEAFSKPIKDHSDKYLAHIDKDRRKIADTGPTDLEKAILKYHSIFRKWAFIIADFPFNRTTFDHFELSQIDHIKVRDEFKKMWGALS